VATLKGGDKLKAYIEQLAAKVKSATVQVGFFESETYPDGTFVAAVAAANEFGATINVPAHKQDIYKKLNAAGTDLLRQGRFVREEISNFAQEVSVPAHTIKIPSRPFFRNMIAKEKKGWPAVVAANLKDTKFDVVKTLDRTGELIAGQLVASITEGPFAPNAPSTIAAKGFSTPLISSGRLRRSVDHKVTTGQETT
jgi:hypothetical protein